MNSLISFDGFSDVVNNLIDKISNAVGWVLSHDTPKKIAVDTYIKDIQESNFDAITKASLISNAKKTIKEYSNQRDIVSMAINTLNPSARPNDVDEDWLLQFMDKTRLVSNSDFQIIWAKILAEECNSPGAIPKALLHILEQMDKHSAESFMKLASVSISFIDEGKIEYTPIVPKNRFNSYFESMGINLNELIELQSLGLINVSDGLTQYSMNCGTSVVARYHEQKYELPKTFPVGEVLYTRIGEVLCGVVFAEKVEGFFDDVCIPYWKETLESIKSKL